VSSSERGRRFLLVAPLLGAAMTLSACGFHLQGREPLPPSLARVHVATEDPQSDFVAAFKELLQASGGEWQATASGASILVRIERDELTQKVLAVSSNNLPREYELTYIVNVAAEQGANIVLPAKDFELSRNFTFDEREVLAKEHERDQLRAELARELAATLLRRLRNL
jgi:LPS-assembly lipoprotein